MMNRHQDITLYSSTMIARASCPACRNSSSWFECCFWKSKDMILRKKSVRNHFICYNIVPLHMKGCIWHFTKWQIHPFICKLLCASYIGGFGGLIDKKCFSPPKRVFLQVQHCHTRVNASILIFDIFFKFPKCPKFKATTISHIKPPSTYH